MPILREILRNTCQLVSPATPESAPFLKIAGLEKNVYRKGKRECATQGMCLCQTNFSYYFFCPSPPFFGRQVDGWTFLSQCLRTPSPSSRTFSDNRGGERISSSSSGSLVLEQCVFCLRGTTYIRNLDKLLVSVRLFGFKCILWLLF